VDEDQVVRKIRASLSGRFDVQKMVLFGSRAKGHAAPDSDWDILVIAHSDTPFLERQIEASRALGHHEFPVDLLLFTPSEYAQQSRSLGSAAYWAECEGRVVYAKAGHA
jgi:predicted nucleotidyltransferase